MKSLWTQNLPRTAGYYWVLKEDAAEGSAWMVALRREGHDLVDGETGAALAEIDTTGLWWAGPLCPEDFPRADADRRPKGRA